MKVVYVPGLEEALTALVKSIAVVQEGGKVPILAIPDEIARKSDLAGFLKEIPGEYAKKTDLAGFLTAVPASTINAIGGVKLFSSTQPQVTDRGYGRSVLDAGGILRIMPTAVAQGVHWSGVVTAYEVYNPSLAYGISDVYSASAINTVIEELKTTLQAANSAVAALTSKVSAAEAALQEVANKASTLEAANAELTSRVGALESKASS